MKERLLLEVRRLTESEAAAVLEFLESQASDQTAQPSWPPRFAASGHSGRPDLGAASEDILRADFGAS
ncbi:MAG: hypothetical protein M3Z66_17040 [Chloroflexota bacterium]|nr:hypothetical protein [Chloroflexota bacterium]